MRWILPVAALVLVSVALPATSAPLSPSLAALEPAAQTIFEQMQQPTEKNIPDALEARAYASFLALSGELQAQRLEPELWESAQSEPDPIIGYMQQVHGRAYAADQALRANLTRLEDMTDGGLPSGQLQELVLAANLLVQAEAHGLLASQYLAGSSQPYAVRTSTYRYTVLAPVTKMEFMVAAGAAALDAAGAQARGQLYPATQLETAIEAAGGAGESWLIPAAGPLHLLARHARLAPVAPANASLEDLSRTLAALEQRYDPDSPAAAILAYVHADAQWWATQAQGQSSENWTPTLSFVNKQARAAEYEQHLLDSSLEGPADWRPGIIAGAAVVAGLAFLVVALTRRRPRRPVAMATLLAVLLLPSAMAHGTDQPHHSGTPTEVPERLATSGPFAVTDGHGGLGNFAIDGSGRTHFVWSGCTGGRAPGCMDVYRRVLEPDGTWGASQRVVDGAANLTLPKLAWDGTNLHLIWLEGVGLEAGVARELHHCRLTADCQQTRLSQAGEYTVLADIDARDGTAVVIWHEEHASQGRIFANWWNGAWSTKRQISDDNRLSRYPDVRLESSQIAHATWQAGLPNVGKNGSEREAIYAKLSPGATLDGPTVAAKGRIDGRARPTIDVLPDGTVGIAYNGWHDVFVTQREGSAWSPPTNVSRTRTSLQSWPLLTATDEGWSIAWTTGSLGTSHMWQSRQSDGYWLRPEIIVQEPYDGMIIVPQATWTDGHYRIVWTGSAMAQTSSELYYAVWISPAASQASAPTLAIRGPGEQSWHSADPVRLLAHVQFSVPLVESGWSVDGQSLPTELNADGNLVSTYHPTAGPHTATVSVRDANGRVTSRSVNFTVDATIPDLHVQVRAGTQAINASGWHRDPISLQATTSADARVQADYEARGAWKDVPDGLLLLEQGILHSLRLRAIDQAGNVNLGPRMSLGWDNQGPTATLDPAPVAAQGARAKATVTNEGAPAWIHVWSGPHHANVTQSEQVLLKLPDGLHVVHAEVWDEAGHRQPVATWNVLVDSTAPTITAEGTSFIARDDGSGLSMIIVDGVSQDMLGATQFTVPPATGTSKVTAVDRAGNEWSGTLDFESGAAVVEVAVRGTGKVPVEPEGSPGPAWALLSAALLVLTARRRKGRKR